MMSNWLIVVLAFGSIIGVLSQVMSRVSSKVVSFIIVVSYVVGVVYPRSAGGVPFDGPVYLVRRHCCVFPCGIEPAYPAPLLPELAYLARLCSHTYLRSLPSWSHGPVVTARSRSPLFVASLAMSLPSPPKTPESKPAIGGMKSAEALQAEQDMINILSAALANILPTKPSSSTTHPPPPSSTTTTTSGVALRAGGACSSAEQRDARVKIPKGNRGVSATERQKCRAKAVQKLAVEFEEPNYDKITSNAGADLAESTLDYQTVISAFMQWCIAYDVFPIFQVPLPFDSANAVRSASSATSYLNLFESFDKVSLETARAWQKFLNEHAGDDDVESGEWALELIHKSTSKDLLIQVSQDFDRLPSVEQGAITFFIMLMNRIVTKTHAVTASLQNYIVNFSIRKFDGENVVVASKHLKAVAGALDIADLPTNMISCVLRGFGQASNQEFAQLCASEAALAHSAIMIKALGTVSPLDHLFMVLDSLNTKYRELCTSDDWSGVNHQGSSFAVESTRRPRDRSHQHPSKDRLRTGPWKPRGDWIKEATCHNCGEKGHIRPLCPHKSNRDGPKPPVSSSKRSDHPKPSSSTKRRSISFKSASDKAAFKKLAYQAVVESFDDLQAYYNGDDVSFDGDTAADDDESSVDKSVNIAAGDAAVEDTDGSDDDASTSDMFQAHAALVLNKLRLN
ncbi:hypothetical protein ACHAXS_009799 [Conticribra weissflogii]